MVDSRMAERKERGRELLPTASPRSKTIVSAERWFFAHVTFAPTRKGRTRERSISSTRALGSPPPLRDANPVVELD